MVLVMYARYIEYKFIGEARLGNLQLQLAWPTLIWMSTITRNSYTSSRKDT